MNRPNRWEAARDPHAAARRSPPGTYGPKLDHPNWSFPVTRAARIVAWVMAAAIAWSYRSDLLTWWPW